MILSVIIPTYNKAALLARTLAALEAQELPGQQWEIVVVDDGSQDGTAQLLAEGAAVADSRLRPVSPGRNCGRAVARDLGLQAARGTYVLFLDDDIVVPPGLLAAHLELLGGRADTGTIGYAVTEAALVDGPHFYYLDSRAVAKLAPGPAPSRYFVTQNAAVPRAALIAAGGFDKDFAGYGFEDMDVGFRLEDRAGLSFQALKQPVPVHVHHHSLDEYFAKKRECGALSLPYLARQHPQRLAEMHLDLILDAPGAGGPALMVRCVRWCAGHWPGRFVQWLVRHWPVARACRPLLPVLYYRLMDVAILSCYRQGLDQALSEPAEPTKSRDS